MKQDREEWKASVISALLPEKLRANVEVSIENERLMCRSAGWRVLVVPLSGVTEITRDTANEYPITQFLMGLATAPSSDHHVRRYREEIAARITLGALSLGGLLFPKHRELVLVSWKDEDGDHDAEFHMSRKQGQAMVHALQKETGLAPRDLEQERKDIEAGKRELRQRAKEESRRK